MSLFHQACHALAGGQPDRLRRILAKRPELIKERENQRTLLLSLLEWPGGKPRAAESLEVLLAAGADPNERAGEEARGETPLHWLASLDHHADLIAPLVEAGADMEATGGVTEQGTPLLNAVHFGQVAAVRELVRLGAWTDDLRIAAGTGQLEKMRAWMSGDGLLQKAAGAVSPGRALEGLLDREQTLGLLEHGLHCALFCEQYAAADWLLEQGADPNAMRGEADSTLLHQVARRGALAMAQFLIARGADPNILGKAVPVAPFQYGAAHANPPVLHYLIDLTAEVSNTEAAYCGRLDRIARLQDYDPWTLLEQTIGPKSMLGRPIEGLFQEGRLAVARYLLQRHPELRERAQEKALEKDDQVFFTFCSEL